MEVWKNRVGLVGRIKYHFLFSLKVESILQFPAYMGGACLRPQSLTASTSVDCSSISNPLSFSECVSYALLKLQMPDISLKARQRSSMKMVSMDT